MDPQIATIIVALLINVPTWYMLQANKRKANVESQVSLSQIDSDNIKDALELKKQYKEDMQNLRKDLEEERTARAAVETQLLAARVKITELQDHDIRREAAMSELKSQFERDSLLRANVEKALIVANEKIELLESSNKSMSERITTLENERLTWKRGITMLIDQIVKHNDEPAWRPPDTQPLTGKVTAS